MHIKANFSIQASEWPEFVTLQNHRHLRSPNIGKVHPAVFRDIQPGFAEKLRTLPILLDIESVDDLENQPYMPNTVFVSGLPGKHDHRLPALLPVCQDSIAEQPSPPSMDSSDPISGPRSNISS